MARAVALTVALVAGCTSTTDAPPPPPTTTTAPPEPTTAPTTSPPPQVAAPAPPAAAPAGVGSVEAAAAHVPTGDVEAAICAAWGAECAAAVRVARCESSLRPDARNGAHLGLFQVATDVHAARIARMGFTVAQMLEVEPNIAVARALWGEQGWRPWACAA